VRSSSIRPVPIWTKKPDPLSEQYSHQVDAYFVNQPGLDAPLSNVSATYADGLVARDRTCLFNGAFDAIRDKGEGRSFVNPSLGRRMGNDKVR
jgi:hypothetical protein